MVNHRLRATLDLIRLPNVFTAVADILAGFLYVGGQIEQWSSLLCLAGASSCLYAGGVALNDVCDVTRDARERPSRPIPSGKITKKGALSLVVLLMILGTALTVTVSMRSTFIALLLVMMILLYDVVFKTVIFAPGLMGICRALNLLLGMSIAPISLSVTIFVPVGLMWLYITSVTIYAREETGMNHPTRLALSTACVCAAVAGLAGLNVLLDALHVEYLFLVVGLTVLLGYRGLQGYTRRTPQSVQRAVKTMILGLILFDACLAWSARGPLAALSVSVLWIPSTVLSRLFRVT